MAATSFLSLFSGCGGLDLGLESIGWRCVAQSEIDKDCVALLEQRFPDIPNLGDITEIDWSKVPPVDGLVGGFPCQDLSYAGRGAGLAGDRSGLYYEMAEAIRQVRPRLILIENVPGLLGRGLHVVTHDLARAGYAGTWRTLAAADVGAPHRRERVFVIGRLAAPELEVGGSPILIGNFAEEGWEAPQTTLLGAELLDRMPKAGAWTARHVYEFELPDDEGDEILLLPTPSSSESTPTDEFIDEMREAGIKPDERLYLPGRKWFAQRTLSRIIPTLLPTPGANDANGGEGETRDARRREGDTGGPSLRDLPKLLPTPTSQLDSQTHRSGDRTEELLLGGVAKAATEGKLLPTPQGRDAHGPQGNAYLGKADDLPAAASRLADGPYALLPTPTTDPESANGHARNLGKEAKLLPTPTTQDGENCGGPSQHERNTPPLNAEVTKLLPTPTAGEAAASGSRNLEGSKAHPGVSLTDAVVYGNSETPRLLPTPTVADAEGGRTSKGKDRPDEHGLAVEMKLLPTPVANPENPGAGGELRAAIHHGPERRTDSDTDTFGRPIRKGRTGKRPGGSKASVPLATALDRDEVDVAWGDYEPAIRRWETILGHSAPPPTDEKGRLAPAFVEWMLGFPEGWVEIPGTRRTAQIRMLGNSVQVQVAQVVGLWLSELGGVDV